MNKSVLVAMSGLKGSLSNTEACTAVGRALRELNYETFELPIGDGGRGTVDALARVVTGEFISLPSTDPLGRTITARVFCMPSATRPNSLYIESPEVCGYHLIGAAERDPMRASSQGLGSLISVLTKRYSETLKRIYVGLGDSAISDAGMGMLCGLGFIFLDQSGHRVWPNANGLRAIKTFQVPKDSILDRIRFTILCDVVNPLCGPSGSAKVFAPQKGATKEQVNLIEMGLENFADLVFQASGRKLREEPMTGSSGGLAAAFLGFLNGELVQGARYLFNLIEFDSLVEKYDVIVTGEGKTDSQSLSGKAPITCLETAQRLGKESVLISGILGPGIEALKKMGGLLGLYECGDRPSAAEALYLKTKEIFSPATFSAEK